MELEELYRNLFVFSIFSFLIPLVLIYLFFFCILFLKHGTGKRNRYVDKCRYYFNQTCCYCVAYIDERAKPISDLSSSPPLEETSSVNGVNGRKNGRHFTIFDIDIRNKNMNIRRIRVKRAFRALYTLFLLFIPICVIWFDFGIFGEDIFQITINQTAVATPDGTSTEEIYTNGQYLIKTLSKITLCLLVLQAWFTVYFFAKTRSVGIFLRDTKFSWRDYFFCVNWSPSETRKWFSGQLRKSARLVKGQSSKNISSLVHQYSIATRSRDKRTGVWIALSGGGIRAASIAVGALEKFNELEAVKNELDKKEEFFFERDFTIKAISAVSGGGYAGSSFLLWKKKVLEDGYANGKPIGEWFEDYKNHLKYHIGFLVHWKEIPQEEREYKLSLMASPCRACFEYSLQSCLFFFNFLKSLWISFLDTIWAVLFLLLSPIILSIIAISPILIILVDIYEALIYFSENSQWGLPFVSDYCLDEIFTDQKSNDSMTWDYWITSVRSCKYSAITLNSPNCKLIEFRDPFPSLFFFNIVSCGIVLLISLAYCIRFGFPLRPYCCCSSRNCVNPEDYSKKGEIASILLVLILSCVGYYASIHANLYKCSNAEIIIRVFMYILLLMNVIIPLVTYERTGGILFLFTLSTLIVAARLQLVMKKSVPGNSVYSHDNSSEPNFFTSWFFAYVIAGFVITISPLLNYARFNIFSHYYRHRVSKTYYPSKELKINMKNQRYWDCSFFQKFPPSCSIKYISMLIIFLIGKLLSVFEVIFRCFRFPFNFQGGFFYINEEELRNITGEQGLEYISQISVHNVSDHYDRPDMFMADSTISKDILIASSKYGYATLRKNKIDRIGKWKVRAEINSYVEKLTSIVSKATEIPDNLQSLVLLLQEFSELQKYTFDKQKQLVTTGGSLRETREDVNNLTVILYEIEDQIESIKDELKDSMTPTISSLLSTIDQIYYLMLKTQNENWEKEPLIATVTAISGGAFSPNFGDQMPDSPASLISLLGGFCGRWIDIKKRNKKLFWADVLVSILLAAISCFIVASGLTLMGYCVQYSQCSRYDSIQTRYFIFWVEIFLLICTVCCIILLVLNPDRLQRWGFVSHPFVISIVSMLSLPFKWNDITSVFASDGGHYENLGIIPLFVHKDIKDNDVIFSLDASGESVEPSGLKNSDSGNEIKIHKDEISPLSGKSLPETKRGEFVRFNKDQKVGKFVRQLNGSTILVKDKDNNIVEVLIECIISPNDLSMIRPGDIVNYFEHAIMIKPVDKYQKGGCGKECQYAIGLSDSEFLIRKENREEYYDDPISLFVGLRMVKEYASTEYEYEYKVDVAELKDYLGDKIFSRLKQDDLALLQCLKQDLSSPTLPKPTRPRYLRVNVKRTNKKDGKVIGFTLYHIRPRSHEVGPDFETGLLGPRFFDPSGLRFCFAGFKECCNRTFNFNVCPLRIEQILSIAFITFFVICLPLLLIQLISEYLLNEVYFSDHGKSIPIIASVVLGVIISLVAVLNGNRKIAVLLSPIAFFPIYLSYRPSVYQGIIEFWGIVGSFFTFLFVVAATCSSNVMFGTFPNHNTVTMQPFGNSHTFNAYSIQGYQGVEDAWYDMLNQIKQNDQGIKRISSKSTRGKEYQPSMIGAATLDEITTV